jgi:YHS domain-containing protein
MGQKYFVCCTGCRDYFNANPEQALAEYKERKAEEKKAKEEAMK